MAKPSRNNQPGAQDRPDDQHGDKAHAAFLENLHRQQTDIDQTEASPESTKDSDVYGRPVSGHHRLNEDREQHDEAEKNSESNRLRG
jgi:hypothetical protein